jgi:hypothetical protein
MLCSYGKARQEKKMYEKMKEEKKRSSPDIVTILCILHSGLILLSMWADKEHGSPDPRSM